VLRCSQVRIAKTHGSKYKVWEGAAALASLHSFMPQWVTRSEYDGMVFCFNKEPSLHELLLETSLIKRTAYNILPF
jgi:hypothetical protein